MMMNSAPSFCRRRAVLCLWLSLLALAPVAPAAINITYYVSDFGLNSNSVRRVTITPISKAGDYSGSYLAPTAMLPDSFTNGTAIFSNKVAGYAYMLSLETTFSTTRRTNMFPSALSGNVNGYNYGALLTGFAADGSVLSWAYYYTTNVTYLIAGSGVTITTNGSAYTIASTGGGGGGVVAASSSVGITTNSSVYTPFVTGTLTNATTGNAATATLATNLVAGANITNATLSSIDNGILWTNYADAVGAQYDSESAGLIFNTDLYAENIHGGIFSGDGQSLTNIPSLFYSTIAQLTNASPSAGVIAYVDSYHSNWFGGGWFKKEASSATIDNGIVFAAPSGRWRRMYPANWPTNWVNAEWFGLWPNNGANVTWNHADQSAALQAAIDATPLVNGATFTPSFGVTISSPLIISNRSSYFFGGRTPNLASGSRYYPRFDSIINWNGATNVPMLKIHDVGHSTFANFGLDTRVPTSNAAYWSNMATIFMDVDMPAGTTTTTADFFKSIMFRERGTNRSLEGIRIAYTSSANCEFMQFEDCQFTGTGANIPNYWMSVTNVGGLYGVRVGGGGGGANSFEHVMRNCNFYGWQYNIYSDSAGTWDITGNKGTAAGVAAYYLNVTGPSSIRFTRNEGDRQFVVAPSVHPIYLQGNEPAQSYSLSISNIEAVDGVNLILDGNRWNADGSGVTRSVTNSFNATGWYVGRNNRFASSSDALFPAGRFASGFNSVGDFGTTATNAWNAKFPLRTWNDALGAFQNVARFSSYGTPYLELMPEFGQVRVGPGAPSASFSVFDTNSTGVIYRFGDNIKSPRFRGLGNGALSELQTFGNTSAWVETSSTNARIDIVSGNAKNTINFRSGYGEITGTNDVQFAQFGRGGLDYTIKFPYDTNFEVVGPIQCNIIRATNHITWFTNDAFASLSATPTRYGQISVVNSGATLYQVTATTNGTLAWASTNQIGSGSGSSATYGFGTNTAAASSWTNSANHVWSGNNTFTSTLIAGSLQSTLDGSATIWDHTSFAGASAGQELFDAFAIAGNKVFGIQSQPNDVQQPTNIFFRVDYPTKQKYGLGSFATNYIANANTAGYTNSRAAPGIGGTNNMVARVVGTSGTLEFYNRSGEYGVTVCGVGVFTNTISSSTWHIPIPVNSGFIIRSGVGVDIQVYAQ